MAKDYDHLFKLLIIGDSGKYINFERIELSNDGLCNVEKECSSCLKNVKVETNFFPGGLTARAHCVMGFPA
jgi:hypothetical protein